MDLFCQQSFEGIHRKTNLRVADYLSIAVTDYCLTDRIEN